MNHLYYGDNLDILRRYVKDESVDLVVLDPPFQSNRDYNVLFAEHSGTKAAAQIKAFEDTWRWDEGAARSFTATVNAGDDVSRALQAFRTILGESDMLAYLAMMAPRLVELHRVLKETGSLYLHCDPTASHYLKMLLDAVFGAKNYRAEIIWKRSSAHNDTAQGRKQYGHIHDTLLFYSKDARVWAWNALYTPYDETYINAFYRYTEPGTGRRYRLSDLTAAKPGGDTSYEWKGVKPYKGRYWAYSREKMEQFEREGRLSYSKSGMPSYKRYLDEMPGVALQDLWDDVPPISPRAAERLGYPTQKPLALLERIIRASSNPGDVVLDPFCGCGTAIDAAQRLDRRWIGIDITALAIAVIKNRLETAYEGQLAGTYTVTGEPTTVEDAAALAASDPYQFQWWALGLVGARPADQKKGADRGIDGRLYFHEKFGEPTRQIIFSVKAGKVDVSQVRDLRGVVEREKAQIGVLISLHEPTRPMHTEAAAAGHYMTGWDDLYPRLQLLTVADLLAGKAAAYPSWGVNRTYREAPRVRPQQEQPAQVPLWTPGTAEPGLS